MGSDAKVADSKEDGVANVDDTEVGGGEGTEEEDQDEAAKVSLYFPTYYQPSFSLNLSLFSFFFLFFFSSSFLCPPSSI